METMGVPSSETIKTAEFSIFDRKLISRCGDECNIPLWQRTGEGNQEKYTKYGHLASARESLLRRVTERRLPALYVHASDKRELYTLTAENCINELEDLLKDPSHLDNKKVAGLVVDWVDISLEEIASVNKINATQNLKRFTDRLIDGYNDKSLPGLMNEVKKLEPSTAQMSVESMIYVLNYLYSLPNRDKDFDKVGAMTALLKDIGMQYVPKPLIERSHYYAEKMEMPTEDFRLIKKHPVDGQNILSDMKLSRVGELGYSEDVEKFILEAVAQHHERMDGSGYPLGLKGDQISKYGKILGVIDVYTTLTSSSRGRNALSQDGAIAELRKLSETKLDKEVVDQFVSTISNKYRF